MQNDHWRSRHLGRLLGLASERYDKRVAELMQANIDLPLALGNLIRRGQVGAAHIQITRHLPLSGARLVDLAASAGMSKQAMADLVVQLEAWNMVAKEPDPLEKRAKRIVFTENGLLWLKAFQSATEQAQVEFEADVGEAVATVVKIGLETYVQG